MHHVKLRQLLIEVDNDLHFTRHFLLPTQCQSLPADEIVSILAAVMTHGCNIGPDTMAQITPEISCRRLQRITGWKLTNETQRGALPIPMGIQRLTLRRSPRLANDSVPGFAKFKNSESIESTRIMIMGQSVPLSAAEIAK